MATTVTLTQEQLAQWLRRAESAHAAYEQTLGRPDPQWPDWYAAYIVKGAADQPPAGDAGSLAEERAARDDSSPSI